MIESVKLAHASNHKENDKRNGTNEEFLTVWKETAMKKYKVLFHLDEAAKTRAELVLNNIDNLIADLGQENVDVELVANSEGVTALLRVPSRLASRVEKLALDGVRITACANSLRQLGLTKDSLLERVEIVPAGVAELVRKQADGWVYIRP